MKKDIEAILKQINSEEIKEISFHFKEDIENNVMKNKFGSVDLDQYTITPMESGLLIAENETFEKNGRFIASALLIRYYLPYTAFWYCYFGQKVSPDARAKKEEEANTAKK